MPRRKASHSRESWAVKQNLLLDPLDLVGAGDLDDFGVHFSDRLDGTGYGRVLLHVYSANLLSLGERAHRGGVLGVA